MEKGLSLRTFEFGNEIKKVNKLDVCSLCVIYIAMLYNLVKIVKVLKRKIWKYLGICFLLL